MFDYIDTRIHIDTDSMKSFGCPEVCAFCKYVKHIKHNDKDSDWVCFGQKDMPTIEDPLRTTCMYFKPEYEIELKEKEPTEENKKEDNTNMIVSPFKEVTIPKTVFNKEYWKVGDAYVIKEKSSKRQITSPKIYVLEEVVETSYVRMDNGVTFSIEEFNNGYFELINHISLEEVINK